jgi:hypothetical protein
MQGSTAPASPSAAAVALGEAAGSILVRPCSSRLFGLLGVEPAAVQYAARQRLLFEAPLVNIFAIHNLYYVLLNVQEVSIICQGSIC